MSYSFSSIDIFVLCLYGLSLIGMGVYFSRKTKTATQFMIADRSIPAWAAGLAVMSAYTSSISYIATPGKAYDDNWHPVIFALCMIPVSWFVCRYVIPWYRKTQTISVYGFLEERLGYWGRAYAAFSFVLYMVGRMAVILYLASLLLDSFLDWNIVYIIITIGVITILYTLLGGMEAVIWTDVIQSIIMICGILYCAIFLSQEIFIGDTPAIDFAVQQDKFSLGKLSFIFSERTVWVMIIYGITENLRNLIADQNYTQKYATVGTEAEAKKSVWIATILYVSLTIVFLYIGTALWSYYQSSIASLPDHIVKGDQVFPYFIATQVPVGLKGLIIAAIIAAAMSTIDSALNCSATVLHLDFYKRFTSMELTDKQEMSFLRWSTVVWGVLGTLFALLMISAKSALDVWWQISGIFGGGILGLFVLALTNIKLSKTQGIITILVSIAVISWGTFIRTSGAWPDWFVCRIDPILVGAVGTFWLICVALLFMIYNRNRGVGV